MPYDGPERRQQHHLDHAEQLTRIETTLENFQRQLLGNGQPGRIQIIESEVGGVKDRVNRVENKIWWAAGALTAISHGVTMFGRKIGLVP